MEYANNGHIKSFKSSNGKVLQDFSGIELEHTYFLRNPEEIKIFLDNMDDYAREILEIKEKLKFHNIRPNFKFGNQEINSDVLKKIIDFQARAFDQIVVPIVNENFEIFKTVFEYAKNKFNQPLLVFADIKLRDPMLAELVLYFQYFKPDGVIWKYRKISSNIQKYRFISKVLTEMKIPYHASECMKRYGTEEFKEISVSAVLKSYFGFSSCCLNYRYPMKKGFPANNIDKFEIQTCSWGKQEKGDYYNKKLKNFIELNKVPNSREDVIKIVDLKRLFDRLDKM